MNTLLFGNRSLFIGGTRLSIGDVPTPPAPALPSDMDFVYLAKDFDGTKITNSATNSTFGDYMAAGTLTTNGSGAGYYLSNGYSDSNYLYKNLDNDQLNAMKAESGTYTFFIRMMSDPSSYVGGVASWRMEYGGYVYMFRSYGAYLQIHDDGGHEPGEAFRLDTDRVYKIQVSGDYFYAKNLETGDTWANYYGTYRDMGHIMTTFNAGFGGESELARFYGFAGIARATTEEEDTSIKNYLMSQGL